MSSESLPVEFLTTTQVGEKGQLTVPSEYRGALQLEKGAQVAVLRLGGALLLIPEHAYFRQLCDRIASVFSNLGITEADLPSTLPGARQRVFERRYPDSPSPQKSSEVGCQQVRSELRSYLCLTLMRWCANREEVTPTE